MDFNRICNNHRNLLLQQESGYPCHSFRILLEYGILHRQYEKAVSEVAWHPQNLPQVFWCRCRCVGTIDAKCDRQIRQQDAERYRNGSDCLYCQRMYVSRRQRISRKIQKRILQMNATNDIHGVKEIQIDCDWTLRSTQRNISISAVIALFGWRQRGWQYRQRYVCTNSQPSPPVDRGVLMMYNTGDFTDIHCQHPILDIHDVAPYLRYIDKYNLPMSTAYPVFNGNCSIVAANT